MKEPITTLQAMSHPTVVATINVLSEMSQRLQDENDELKAALAQPEQEPVLCQYAVDVAMPEYRCVGKCQYTPPQRPWVGLTGQEKALVASVSLDVHDAVHRTDAKLKEKNT